MLRMFELELRMLLRSTIVNEKLSLNGISAFLWCDYRASETRIAFESCEFSKCLDDMIFIAVLDLKSIFSLVFTVLILVAIIYDRVVFYRSRE